MTRQEFWEAFHQLPYRDASDPRYQRAVAQIARDTLEDDFTHLQRQMRSWPPQRVFRLPQRPAKAHPGLPPLRFGFDRRLHEVMERKW